MQTLNIFFLLGKGRIKNHQMLVLNSKIHLSADGRGLKSESFLVDTNIVNGGYLFYFLRGKKSLKKL